MCTCYISKDWAWFIRFPLNEVPVLLANIFEDRSSLLIHDNVNASKSFKSYMVSFAYSVYIIIQLQKSALSPKDEEVDIFSCLIFACSSSFIQLNTGCEQKHKIP